MRIALYKYIDANKNGIYNSETQVDIGNLLPSAYITKEGYNFKEFYEEFLLSMHSEAEKIIIYLSPILFNVNLDLYILEGTAKIDSKGLNYFKQTFPCILGNDKMNNFSDTISLLYRFSHYDKLYTHRLMINYNNYITFRMLPYDERIKTRITVFTECVCESCKRKSELIVFSHIPNIPLCKLCVIDLINKIIVVRVKSYISEFYNNKECIYIIYNTI